MTAAAATDEKRVAVAMTALVLGAIAAASFGWLLLNEALGLVQALGGVPILFGIWVARPRGGRLEVGR